MYVLYVDLLFLINFVMDIIIFAITTMILNKPLRLKKIVISGITGAMLYCMLLMYPVLQRLPYSLYALLVPVIPILYLYKPIKLKEFIKYYLLSTGVAALIGGVSFTLWYQLKWYMPDYKPTIGYILVIGLSVGAVVYLSFYGIRKRFLMPYFEYDLEIHYEGKMERLPALLDTGNMLYTPISHKPVIVVTYDAVKKLLTKDECEAIETCQKDIEKMIEGNIRPRYIIPFHSMGCENGMLWGVVSEYIILHKDGVQKQLSNCVMGIAFGSLCSDRAYKALLHPDFVINEGE